MKISERWLRQWTKTDLSAEQIGERLTMAGLELESAEPLARPFSGVVVGQIVKLWQHPNADKLRVALVDVGMDAPLQIVCGASNAAEGARAPVALVGAKLPPADGSDKPFVIKKGKLRGEESRGMLCGGSELDIDDGVDGLLILPSDAPIGVDVRQYLQLDDCVLDIAVTPNRGDCLSVRGVARELAAITDGVWSAPFEVAPVPLLGDIRRAVVGQTQDCPLYIAQTVSDLSAKTPSPDWLKRALVASGIKPRNLLVDVTNYVLMELGQPLHAFDADKLVGDICVRRAQKGETLTLLNEQNVVLQGDEIVIADDEGAVALAGVMGGLRTAVDDSTTSVVIESAFFDPVAMAGKARRFGLHTDASQRFERGVDYAQIEEALDRAVALLVEYGQGRAHQKARVQSADLPTRAQIRLPIADIKKTLGVDIDADVACAILNRLQICAERQGDALVATAPSFRYDIAIAEDLIEEIARVYGYDRIENRLPSFAAHFAQPPAREERLKDALINAGYYEAISFSFGDAATEALFDEADLPKPLVLANPLSADLAVMRRGLLSGLLPCAARNLKRQLRNVRLFETGLCFVGDAAADLRQIPALAMVAIGLRQNESPWASDKNAAMDFFDFKGDVERLLPCALIKAGKIAYARSRRPFLHAGQSADVYFGDRLLGYFGQLHPKVAKALDLPTTWVAQLDLQSLAALPDDRSIATPSKFPQVRRDFAFLVDKSVAWQDMQAVLRQSAGRHLQAHWLFDVYEGDALPEGKKSLAFAVVWQDDAATLSDDAIKAASDAVVAAITAAFDAQLRDA